MSEEIKRDFDKEVQEAAELGSRTHLMFNTGFKLMYFEREDGKPLAARDPAIKDKIVREDNEQHKLGKKVNVLLKIADIKEMSQVLALKNSEGQGQIRFHPTLEWQLILILFEQVGLTHKIVDPKPEPANAAA